MILSKPARRLALLPALALAASLLPSAPALAEDPVEVTTVVADFEAGVQELSEVTSGTASVDFARSFAPAVGDAAAELDFHLGVGAWAGAELRFDDYEASEISFWVRSTDVDEVTVRLIDANGQTFQHWPAVEPDGTWQQVVIDELASDEYWGGTEDGVFAQPLNNFSIIVNNWEDVEFEPVVFLDDVAVAHTPVAVTGPELVLGTGNVGNIAYLDEPLALPIRAGADYEWRVSNLYGAVVSEGAGSAGTGALSVPTDELGYFLLEVSAQDETGTSSAAANFGVVGDRPGGELDPFGVATHFGQSWSPEILDILERGGFSHARDEAYWHEVETTPGVFELPSKVVTYTDRLAADGVGLHLVLSYSNDFYDDGEAPQTQAGREAFAAYAVEMIDRFGTEDVVYEVWNEWNIGLGTETPDMSADGYYALLEVVVDAVRAAHPDAELHAPSLAGVDEIWLERFYELGGLDLIDGLSIHPYVYPDAPEALDSILARVRAQMDRFGGQDVEIVISEHGWPTGSAQKSVDELTQSAYLLRAQAISLAHGVQQYVIYDLVDDGPSESDTEQRFGLTRHNGSPLGSYAPKPAFIAQSVLMRVLDDAEFVSRNVSGGVHDYAFDADGTRVRMLWAPNDAVVTLPAQGPVTVTDATGREVDLVADSTGNITLGLTGEPLFVTGDTGAAVAVTNTSLAIASAALGTPLGLEWQVTNPGDAPAEWSIDVEGSSDSVTVAAGGTDGSGFDGPVVEVSGDRTVFGVLSQDGLDVGLLRATAQVRAVLGVTARHALSEAGDEVLRLELSNRSSEPLVLSGATWTIDRRETEGLAGATIPAGGTLAHDVTLPATIVDERYQVRVEAETGEVATASGRVFLVQEWWEADEHTIVVDGVPDVPSGTRAIDFAGEGVNWIDDHAGDSDLSAQGWVTWDETHFHLTVEVVDDVHFAPYGGSEMWNGDSVQLAIATGAPGEARTWSEIDLGTGPDGPELYRRMAEGKVPGPIAGAEVAVVRDETAATTTYEASIAWADLDGGIPNDGFFSFSVLVNENDGTGRRGTLEWAEGISGVKDSALFRAVELIAAEEPTPAPEPTPTPTPDPTPDPGPSSTTGPSPDPGVTPQPEFDVYTTPGFHEFNGRRWFTACEPYSRTSRCWTLIHATTVTNSASGFVAVNTWVFNNLTYAASPRHLWAGNPLASTGQWKAADGRDWRTECDTALTGRNGCRSFVRASMIGNVAGPGEAVRYGDVTGWVLNNIVRFS